MKRLALSLLYLGAVLCIASVLLHQLRRAEGELLVTEGRTESVLVCEEGDAPGFGGLRRAPLEAIPFDNPEAIARRVGRTDGLDAVVLPFHVRLDQVELIRERYPSHFITVTGPEGASRLLPHEKAVEDLPGGPARLKEYRPWSGLIHHALGRPMVSLALRRGDGPWVNHTGNAGSFATVDGVAVTVLWQDREAAAKAALPGVASLGRWGVAEGDTVQWFQPIVPGTGVALQDGRQVTLVAYDEKRPAIRVRIRGQETDEVRWYTPDAGDPAGPVRFEHAQLGIAVCGFGVDEAWLRAFRGGEALGDRLLRAGETWDAGAGLQVRLDQALGTAIPIPADEAGVWCAVFGQGDEEFVIREGETKRFENGVTLHFTRDLPPPEVVYHLTVVSPTLEERKQFSLWPGQHARYGQWRFEQGVNTRNALHSAVLKARRVYGPSAYVGAALFLIGAVGLVAVRGGAQAGAASSAARRQ